MRKSWSDTRKILGKLLNLSEPNESAPFEKLFYDCDQKLLPIWLELTGLLKNDNLSTRDLARAGELMEQVAFLAFHHLMGVERIDNFQSAGPQFDLVVSGDSEEWMIMSQFLLMPNYGTIIVECKATHGKLDDPTFSRMCALLSNTVLTTGGLGVFFTLNGASGFPSRRKSGSTRQRMLRDCQLRQVRFMDQHKKPILVFDREDLEELCNGRVPLPSLIRAKIRDIEEASGLAPVPNNLSPQQCDLPPHLKCLREQVTNGV